MSITYHGEEIGTRRVDFFNGNKVLVEIKAVIEIVDVHLAQAVNYLEASDVQNRLTIKFWKPQPSIQEVVQQKFWKKR